MNKILKSVKVVVLALVATLVVACQSGVDAVQSYINLSDSTISFGANPVGDFKIAVDASGEWTYTISGDWLSEVSSDETGLTIQAESNGSSSMRSATITFSCGSMESKVLVYQNSVSANVNLELNSLFTDGAVSPSGEFVAGMAAYDDSYAKPTLINTLTGEVLKYPVMSNEYVVTCVDDSGQIFIVSGAMISGYHIEYGGTAEEILVPDEMKSGGVNGVSADGTIWVGFACPTTGGWEPMRWVNGVPELLPRDVNNSVGQTMWYGCAARGCSADGSIIYGNYLDYQDAIYWDANLEMHFVAPELLVRGEYDNGSGTVAYTRIAGASINADSHVISQNGKYLAFKFEDQSSGFTSVTPAYLNLETGAYYLFEEHSGKAIVTIGDDGSLFFTPYMSYGPTTVVTPQGEEIDGMDWVEQNYGLIIEDSRAILQVSQNGNLFGFKGYDSSYLAWWLTKN